VTRLAELTTKIGSGATPRGGRDVYLDEGVALIRSQNVYDSNFVWSGLAHISGNAARQLAGVQVNKEDVLINITGASILRTCIVDPDVLPARVNQHVAIIRARPGIPARYLHLYMLQPNTKSYLIGLNAGGSREAVTKAHLESVPVIQPGEALLERFGAIVNPVYAEVYQNDSQSRVLGQMRDTLLPKLLSGELPVPLEVAA
jgi:type I restriction enzyme S subunit